MIRLALLFVLILAACRPPEPKAVATPEAVARKLMNDLPGREKYMMYDTEDVKAIHYAEVCAAFGAVRIAGLLGDKAYIGEITRRYSPVLHDSLVNTANHVDANVYGILPLELYLQQPDSAYLRQGLFYADGQWEGVDENGLTTQTRFWIDDVYMIGSLQVQAFRATGNKVYLDRAASEVVAYLDKLQHENGLFHHGPEAPFYWGRGNGWVAAGLAELLTVLPAVHPQYARIRQGYVTMMEALVRYQSEGGMWLQLIDDPAAWPESSCTAMFGYALAVGVKKGILTEDKFRTAYEKAWHALQSYISSDGKVAEVCAGTGQSTDRQYYLQRPRITGDFHGQAPVLWFAFSLMNTYAGEETSE